MDSARMPPISSDTLLEWARDPARAAQCNVLQGCPALLFTATFLPAPDEAQACAWLAALPCPSIAIAPAPCALAAAADVWVPDRDAAERLQQAIARAPIATAVLVLLLRLTASLPLEQALVAESLAYSTLQAGPEYRHWLASHRAAAPAPHQDHGAAVLMQREGAHLRLTLNRASNRNAMSVELRDALMEAFQLVLADTSIEQVQLDARGACFSTGGDLTEFGSAPDPARAHLVRSLALPGRLLAACAARVEVRLHGACIGSGIELPAFAGRLVARADSWFQLPELNMGLIPGAGGCISIARRMGRQRLAEWVLSGQRIRAPQALEWGLIDAIVDD